MEAAVNFSFCLTYLLHKGGYGGPGTLPAQRPGKWYRC